MDMGRLLFRARNQVAALPLLFALWWMAGSWGAGDLVTWTSGIVLAVAGVMMRGWSTCHCRYSTGQKKLLAMTGPYAHLRNPLYVGNIAIILGGVVASGVLWFLPIAALWCFATYALVVRFEEGVMLAKFGADYAAYKEAVPGWLPRRTRYGDAAVVSAATFASAVARQAGNLVVLFPFALRKLFV